MEKTREPQYQRSIDIRDTTGLATFGLMSNQVWYDDPRRIAFVLSRYKFVAKMLSGCSRVLEVGCADAFGTRIVLQEVRSLVAVDFDPVFVKDVNDRMDKRWQFDCIHHDMLQGPVEGGFDGAFCCDVLEHIEKRDEKLFLQNIRNSLVQEGVLIVGTPSLQSQAYASPPSKAGHVNCKTAEELKAVMRESFLNVFIFSMNDEVVHTGFYPMAQYLFAVCCQKRAN
jgi:2-polyprenyl-3-methyl-5-hydroxy-6-metoxy-1,4-benzoquinol methylase